MELHAASTVKFCCWSMHVVCSDGSHAAVLTSCDASSLKTDRWYTVDNAQCVTTIACSAAHCDHQLWQTGMQLLPVLLPCAYQKLPWIPCCYSRLPGIRLMQLHCLETFHPCPARIAPLLLVDEPAKLRLDE